MITPSDAWCAAYLACLLLVGYAAMLSVEAFQPRSSTSRIERFGYSACLGPALVGWSLIFWSLMGHVPTRGSILTLAIVAGGLVVFLGSRRKPALPKAKTADRFLILWIVLALIVVAYGVNAVGSDAFVFPTLEWDAFAIWQLKAKVLVAHPLWPRPDYFGNLNLSFSHLTYPILVPMMSAGSMVMSGVEHDELGKAPYLLLYLGLGSAIFGYLYRTRGTSIAVCSSALMMTLPVLLNYAGTGTAELALVAFYGCSLVCLLRWQQDQRASDWVLTILFSAAMAWTKNEGAPLAAMNGVAMLFLTPRPLYWRNLSAAIAFGGIVGAMYLPWWLYTLHVPRVDEAYGSRLSLQMIRQHAWEIPTIISHFFNEFTGPFSVPRLSRIGSPSESDFINCRDWSFFWWAPAALVVLNPTSLLRRPVVTVWILFAMHLAAYIIAYMITNWNLDDLFPVTINRLALHFVPLGALMIGLQWPGESNRVASTFIQ